jgi:hypothetical protein
MLAGRGHGQRSCLRTSPLLMRLSKLDVCSNICRPATPRPALATIRKAQFTNCMCASALGCQWPRTQRPACLACCFTAQPELYCGEGRYRDHGRLAHVGARDMSHVIAPTWAGTAHSPACIPAQNAQMTPAHEQVQPRSRVNVPLNGNVHNTSTATRRAPLALSVTASGRPLLER